MPKIKYIGKLYKQKQETHHEMRQRTWTFYDDIVHLLQNTKQSNEADIYKKMVKSDLQMQLNLKIIMNK